MASKKVFFENYVFQVFENVYEPAEDSFLFAEHLCVRDGDVVLDMGTGCGVLGIVATEKASEVVAVDINPYAVKCAGKNARLNYVADKMCFVRGDLFSAIDAEERFDLVLFNAPYLPSEGDGLDSWLEQAWSGGVSGRRVIDRFISEVGRYLKQNGSIFLMQSTLSNVDETMRRFADSGLEPSTVVECSLPFFETIVLVKAEKLNLF